MEFVTWAYAAWGRWMEMDILRHKDEAACLQLASIPLPDLLRYWQLVPQYTIINDPWNHSRIQRRFRVVQVIEWIWIGKRGFERRTIWIGEGRIWLPSIPMSTRWNAVLNEHFCSKTPTKNDDHQPKSRSRHSRTNQQQPRAKIPCLLQHPHQFFGLLIGHHKQPSYLPALLRSE